MCVFGILRWYHKKGGEEKTVMKRMKFFGAIGDGGSGEVGRGILHRVNFFKQKQKQKKTFLHLRKRKKEILSYIIIHRD